MSTRQRNKITGHIWAQQIESSDNNVAYTNHIINCTIQLPEKDVLFPLVNPVKASDKIYNKQGVSFRNILRQ